MHSGAAEETARQQLSTIKMRFTSESSLSACAAGGSSARLGGKHAGPVCICATAERSLTHGQRSAGVLWSEGPQIQRERERGTNRGSYLRGSLNWHSRGPDALITRKLIPWSQRVQNVTGPDPAASRRRTGIQGLAAVVGGDERVHAACRVLPYGCCGDIDRLLAGRMRRSLAASGSARSLYVFAQAYVRRGLIS